MPLGGCAYDAGAADGTLIGEVREPAYYINGVPLFTTNNWEVPVCYHTASTGSVAAKALFEQTVREQWEANTGLTFTGFRPCESTDSPWIPVYIIEAPSDDNVGGDRFGLGAYGVGARIGANDGDSPLTRRSSLLTTASSFTCLSLPRTRSVTPSAPYTSTSGRTATTVRTAASSPVPPATATSASHPVISSLTVNDPLSVMHYCFVGNGATSNILSQLDYIGGQIIHGRPSTATAELGFQRVVLSGIPPAFSFNSTGATNSFIHHGPGQYTALFPRLGQTGANVQVTPYNSRNRCSIAWWSDGYDGGAAAAINCFDAAGTLTDTEFTVSFVGRWDGPGIPEGGYVWAYDPSSDFYTATGSYTWNSTGAPVTIDRTSAGVYDVLFVGQNFNGGTAEVSAYGGGTEYCKLDSLVRVGSDKRVRVRCFSRTGTPADAYFSLRLNSFSPMGTPTYSYALADQPSSTQVYTPSSGNRLAYRPNLIGGTTNLQPLTVTRVRAGEYTVDLPQMPYTDDPLYLYKKSNLHVTAVGTGPEYCQISAPRQATRSGRTSRRPRPASSA